MIFGWRKRQIADMVDRDIDNIGYEVPFVTNVPALKVEPKEAYYTIGVNSDGKTQFRMNIDYGSATLTMTPEGVKDLIEDLAHAIRREYEIIINKIDKEE